MSKKMVYTDDHILLAQTEDGLQINLHLLQLMTEQCDMEISINILKTNDIKWVSVLFNKQA
jgi:hypothetical protein